LLVELVSIVAPIYCCALLGYLWTRTGRHYDSELIGDLTMTVGAPCLVFYSLVTIDLEPSALVEMAGASALAIGVMGVLSTAVLLATRQPLHTFLAPMTLPNTGNMGLPVCLFAFGQEGLALGVCVFAVTSITQFTLGMSVWAGKLSWSQLLRTPVTLASLLAVAAIASDFDPPLFVLRTTQILGGMTIPLMQFTLGVSMGRLELGHVPRALALSIFRLGLGAAVGALVAEWLGLEGVARGVLILDCAMPVAVVNYILAVRYRRSPTEVAGTVVISTLLSFGTLPVLLAWVL
jgi:predicted permease